MMAANIKIEPLPMDRYSPLTINVNAMDDDKVQKQLMKRQRESKSERYRESKDCFKENRPESYRENKSDFHLMEYRQAPASPGASSVHSQDMDNADILASPPPSPPPIKQDMDDDRLPNELLEEICEDIGMKEGMELDFVEFLMEQDMVDPHMYMTPEAIKNTLATVSSGSSSIPSSVTFAIPSNKTTFSAEIQNKSRSCSSPTTTYSQASSTNGTVATSSGSSSPVAKRFHVSTSGPSSPVRSKPPNEVFKAPPTPPTPRRPSSNSQSIASPSISSTQGPFSPQPTSSTPQKQPPPYSQATSQHQIAQKCMQQRGNVSSGAYNYQRLGRPAPPNVNVQNMQQQWPGKNQQNHMNPQMNQMNQACAMNGNMRYQPQTQQYSRHRESPMDNGYFSADTGSVRSYGSSVPSTMSSASSSMTAIHRSTSLPDQKSVHFADDCDPQVLQQQHSTEGLVGYNPYNKNIPDCDLIENQRNQPSKMLSRLSSNMKPDIAPYNVNYPRGSNSRPGSGDNPMAPVQQFDYPHNKAGDIFDVDNNQNNMFINNYNSSMQNHALQEPDFSSCSGGAPMGMQPLRHFDEQNSCNMQMNPNHQMYGSMQRNKCFKNDMDNMNFCDNQYGPHPGQNMSNSCSMMNPGSKMMSTPHGPPQGGMMGHNCNPNFQDEFGQQHMSRQMHMNNQPPPQMMRQGSMGNEFDQSQYNRLQGANMNDGMFPPESQPDSAQNMCPPNWEGAAPQTPQPQPGMHPKGPHPSMSGLPMPGMQTPGQNPMQGGGPPMPCTIPNCQSCKTGSPHRPPMLSSQQSFIQHLITDRSSAFRSHPLFPLLRDLIIADMNFASPHFPYQLISNLPADFDKLLQNFLHRNPPSGQYQNNYAVESVIMDALKYAHHCLIEKIRSRQEQDKHTKSTSKSLSAIEEFCEKFDRSVRNSVIKPATFQVPNSQNQVSTTMGGPMGPGMTPQMETPTKDHKFSAMDNMMMQSSMFASPMAKKNLEMSAFSGQFKSLKDLADFSDNGSLVSSSSSHGNKSESKKHPSLPKEAVAIMLDWLRQHKDNPYPNDDEKAMLIKQTGLTINQINYWFTNARRRILPKWAQQCK